MNVFLQQRSIELDALDHICLALEKTLEWEVPEEVWVAKASSVRFLMQSLRRYAERIFTAEEQGGYMASELQDHPELAGRASVLEAEHDEIRASLRKILHRMEVFWNLSSSDAEALYAEIGRLATRVRRHHDKEERLLQDAMLQDTGGEG